MRLTDRRLLALVALSSFFCLTMPVLAQNAPLRVAVLPFDAQAGVTQADAAAMTELVRSAIAVTNEFALIENQAAQAILDETGFGAGPASLDDASRLLAERLDAAFTLLGAMSAEDESILISVRLIDAATASVIFVHRTASTAATIHREARLFAEGIANEVVAMTAGATVENIERLLSLGRLDEAARKLDAARLRAADAPDSVHAALDALERSINAGLADEAYKAARSSVAQADKAGKDFETGDTLMASARESGNDALFLIPDGPEWIKQRDKYLDFMLNEVMSYYAAEDRSRREAVVAAAREALRQSAPDEALRIIDDYVQVAGERAIDKSVKTVLDAAKSARADGFIMAARSATSESDYARAERFLSEAAYAGTDPARLAQHQVRLETAMQRDQAGRIQAERFASSMWDPASRPRFLLEAGMDLATIDTPSSAWPLGGVTPMPRLSAALYERVSGPILFDWRLALRAGSSTWSGLLDAGTASVSYWKTDAALLAGFTVAAKNIDAGLGAGALFGAAGYEGNMDAYGTAVVLEPTLAPYLGAVVRAKVRYRWRKNFGAGIDLERSLTWSPKAGTAAGLAIGFFAEASF